MDKGTKAKKSAKGAILFAVVTAAVLALDQVSKWWIVHNVAPGRMQVWPGVIGFAYAENTGAAFSFFSGMRWVLAVFSALVALGICAYVIVKKPGAFASVSAALVTGGAVGNALDRFRLGYVVDFFSLEFVDFAIFNVADVCIDIGAALIVVCLILAEVRAAKARKAEAARKAPPAGGGETGEAERDPS